MELLVENLLSFNSYQFHLMSALYLEGMFKGHMLGIGNLLNCPFYVLLKSSKCSISLTSGEF